MTKYYARLWLRDGDIFGIHSNTHPIVGESFTGWSDEIIDLEIAGEYQDAADLRERITLTNGNIIGAGVTETARHPGIPRDIEAELAEFRGKLKLSFAQLLIGLVAEGWITQAEGTAWIVNRVLPSPITALIGQLPADQQFAALARAVAPSEVLRLDPLVVLLGNAQGKTPAEIDAFFVKYKDQ